MQPLLSIIIPCYNVEHFLQRCLDSMDKTPIQNGQCQIIIIDDGSTDKTFKIATEWKENFPSTILVKQENCGLSASRNKGIDLATGTFLWFVDSDDCLSKNAIEKLACELEHSPENVFLFGMEKQLENGKWKPFIPSETGNIASYKLLRKPFFRPNVYCYVYRNEWLKQSGIRFRIGQLFEDVCFSARILLKCDQVKNINQPLYLYHYNNHSIMNKNTEEHRRVKLCSQRMVLEHLSELLIQTKDPKKRSGIEQIILSNRSVYLTLLYQYHPNKIKNYWTEIPDFSPTTKLGAKDRTKYLMMKYCPVFYGYVTGHCAPQP